MTPLATNALKIAQSQIGKEEFPKGSNAGIDVEKYLHSVGLGKGYSWCMAFIYWVVMQASKKEVSKNPLKKTGGVLDQYNSNPALRHSMPQEGDIFIMDYGDGKGHAGFVEILLPNGKIQTIEGNTNADGSRDGYLVCRRTRNISTINKGFLRL